MKFLYQARNKQGDFKKGVVTASSQAKAEQILNDNQLIIISLTGHADSLLKPCKSHSWKFFQLGFSYKDLGIILKAVFHF